MAVSPTRRQVHAMPAPRRQVGARGPVAPDYRADVAQLRPSAMQAFARKREHI
jgi:energy-converting hydrogenase Eha subunit F